MNRAYQIIADRILDMLDRGEIPWRKPWAATAGNGPMNAFTRRPYRGINTLILGMSAYADPRWATFKQVRQYGGHVNAGEKATPVVFWKQLDIPADDEPGQTKSIPFMQTFYVFNVAQCVLPNLSPITVKQGPAPIETADRIIAAMPQRPSIANDGGDRAYYRPASDSVHMPPMGAFGSADYYYTVLFHELTHSTGHKARLDRGLSDNLAPFGSADYSKEELVAEFGAAFLSAESGIKTTIANSAAYVQSWAKVIRNDKTVIIHAASKAQKAADYILNRAPAVRS